MNTDSIKRVLLKMKKFARGERLKGLQSRINPKGADPIDDPEQTPLAATPDDPELMGLAEGSPAEEGAETPAEEDEEEALKQKLLAHLSK